MAVLPEVFISRTQLFPDITGPLFAEQRLEMILEVLKPRMNYPRSHGPPDFELESPIGEDYRAGLVETVLTLPETEARELFRLSSNLTYISENAATHKALERMYLGPGNIAAEETAGARLWAEVNIGNIHNSMAVRNRLRMVESEFSSFLQERLGSDGDKQINVLSVAAGSSRAIMEVLSRVNGRGGERVRLRMVDLSRNALEDGRRLVEELAIDESVDFIRAHFLMFDRYLEEGYRPDFVEIVGLLDYLQQEDILKLLTTLRTHMAEGGRVLYSNITPNDEQEFTHKVVGWPAMRYRTANELMELATEAGFSNATLVREPLNIYNLLVAVK